MNPLVQNLKKSFGPLVQPFVNGVQPPTAMMSTFATPKPVAPSANSSTQNMSMAPVKPIYPTPSGNPINMSMAPKQPVAPATPTGDPAVRAQQIALNANGAGLKVDGILGPLTMAAIKNSESTVKKTPAGGIINPNTGGFSEAPVPPATTTYPAPAVPEPTPTVSPYETNVTNAEKAYQEAGLMTPEEIAAQAELDKLTESFKTGYQGIEDKVIPMNFITGQQASLENRALNLAEPLKAKLARLQAKRTSALEASKFALERADAKLESEKTAAEKEKDRAQTEGFTLGKDQVRYDAFGNVVARGMSGTEDGGAEAPTIKTFGQTDYQWNKDTGEWDPVSTSDTSPQVKVDKAQSVIDLIKTLGADAEGFSGAVGAKGLSSFFGLKDNPIAGTAAAGYVNRFNQLVGMLTLENMGVMKGVLSDADIKIIKEASTALNRNGRETDFVTELGKLEKIMQKVIDKGGQGESGGLSPDEEEYLRSQGYSDEDIQSLKGSVGNTKASIPQTSRLAYVNNNPGNLRFAGQQGAIPGEGGFAKFSSIDAGVKALENQIKLDASRGLTLAQFVTKYAPPTENDTNKYIQDIIKMTGASSNTRISSIDISKLTKAIAQKESSTKIYG